jgi:hypothetical protein
MIFLKPLKLDFLEGETVFRTCASTGAAADAPTGVGNLHKAFFSIADFDLVKRKDALGAGLEAAAAADTGIHVDAGGEFRSPDLTVSGKTGN